jgi:hypothetical protein
VGNWVNGVQQGKGTKSFENGDEYDGEFYNGNYHGQGIFNFQNGDQYEG